MSALIRSSLPFRTRGGAIRSAATSAARYGRSPAYRRIHLSQGTIARFQPPHSKSPRLASSVSSSFLSQPSPFSNNTLLRTSPLASRAFHQQVAILQNQRTNDEVKDRPRSDESATGPSDPAKSSADNAGPSSGSSSGKQEDEREAKEEGQQGSKDDKKKREEPPPPPHGNKSPLQVFMDTLKSEFQASKEWNEGTKQLGSRYSEFTQNENLKRARGAFGATSDAVTSTTGKVFKTTGSAIGKSAAWTWDTMPVKGVRVVTSATGSGIEKLTRPLRETEAYKSMSNVIDDGSSSRYGGWTEKEQRRQRRETREMQDAAASGRPIRRPEKIEEDPE